MPLRNVASGLANPRHSFHRQPAIFPNPRGGSAVLFTATSQRLHGTVRQTHRLFRLPRLVSLSPVEHVARYSPRYLLHGVVAAVSVAAISSIALPPRTPAVPAADAAAETLAAPALVALDVAPPEPSPTPTPAPAFESDFLPATIAPAQPPKPITHTVEEGESVRMLAAKFGISPETIMAANNLRNPDMLKVGQDLVILPTDGVLYALRQGETLRRVAERFSVDLADIIDANELGDPDMV